MTLQAMESQQYHPTAHTSVNGNLTSSPAPSNTCHYVSVRRRAEEDAIFRRASATGSIDGPTQPAVNERHDSTIQITDNQLTSPEANSVAAFVRKLAVGLDPANAPRLHLFAWNLFLGARTSTRQPYVRPITEIISQATMESLTTVYLAKVDPCYGIIDHELLQRAVSSRWSTTSVGGSYDAVLCGIAALGMLFSRIQGDNVESDLVATARHILEQSDEAGPSVDIVTGWVLRVAYLRMTAPPHIAWMASCTMIHALEASGMHSAEPSRTAGNATELQNAPELSARLIGIARHLNIWISYDLGRSRVALPQDPSVIPSARPGDYTTELLSLLPISELLGREKDPSIVDLKAALRKVVAQSHTEPPSVLAQSNLTLLLTRRLRALDCLLSGTILDDVLQLMRRALTSVETLLATGNPWHHVANVPFQMVCILLSVDTPSTIALLGDAVRTLNSVAQVYDTEATREALNTACLLIHLHQKRKSSDAASLAGILQTYSSLPSFGVQNDGAAYPNLNEWESLNNTAWLDDLMTDLPNLQDFDVNQLLGGSTQMNFPYQW